MFVIALSLARTQSNADLVSLLPPPPFPTPLNQRILSNPAACSKKCFSCCRTLRRLTMDDAAEASHMFTLLMGENVAPRRRLIEEHGGSFSLEQLDV